MSLLLGGPTVGIAIGLPDVLVFHAGVLNSQTTVSAGIDLALGLLLLATGARVRIASGPPCAQRLALAPVRMVAHR